jgi:protocatechuate 3,4-dioxygenase beta subunit
MSQLSRDLAAGMDRRRVLGGLTIGIGGVVLAGCGSRAGAQGGTSACPASPTETRGPFPADGSNGRQQPINVLDLDGVVRRDIRSGFAGMGGMADGVQVELEIELVEATCTSLPGHAIYLWQNDAVGDYSLYNNTATNYLRGLQSTDANGRVRFTSIVPGCYGGRYPHCHFEVFESAEAAIGGARPLLVSQLAFPAAECRAIYRNDPRYGDSLRNLERQPIERDFVFGDSDPAGQQRQTLRMTGDPGQGYRGTARAAIRSG